MTCYVFLNLTTSSANIEEAPVKSMSRVVISILLLVALLVGTLGAYAQDEEPTFTITQDASLRDTAHDTLGEELEVLWSGRTGEMLGRSRGGNFVYVTMDSGATGWLRVADLETEYTIEDLPVQQSGQVEIVPPLSPTATIVAETLLRDTPHEAVGEDLEVVPAGEVVAALGATRAGNYIYVETATGAKGWVDLADVELNVGPTALPVEVSGEVEIVQPAEPVFTVTEDAVLGDRPADLSKPVEEVWEGRTGMLEGRTANGNYVYVEMDSGAKGWLPVSAVQTDYPIDRLVVQREVEIVQPASKDFVILEDAELADRPGDRYHIVDELWYGREGVLVGRTANSNYAYVEMDNDAKGWVPAGVVESEYPVAALPVMRDVEIVEPTPATGSVTAETPLRDTAHDAVGEDIEMVPEGESLDVMGRSRAGSFIYAKTSTGAMGWLDADNVELNVGVSALPVEQSGKVELAKPVEPTFMVVGEAMLRDTAHDAVGEDVEELWEGREGTLLGRSNAGNFYYVEMDSGAKGWIGKDSVTTDFPPARLEVVKSGSVEIAESAPKDFWVTEDGVVLADRPSDRNKPVEELWSGRTGTLEGRTANGNYVYVEMDSEARGWLPVDVIETEFTISALPVMREVEIVEPTEPTATVIADGAVLRDTAHDTLGEEIETLRVDEVADVLGITRGGNFVHVETVTGAKGWVASGDVELNIEPSAVPIARSGSVEILMPQVEPTFTITAETALRDTAHDEVGEDVEPLWEGRTGTLLGITRGGNFYYAETDSGAKGWIAAGAVETEFPSARLSEEQSGNVEIVPPPAATFTVTGEAMVRTAAHEALGEDVESVWEGRTGTLLGVTRGGNFYYVEMDSGAKGWLDTEVVSTDYPVELLRVEQSGKVETAQPLPKSFVLPDTAELRDRPSDTYHTVEALEAESSGVLAGRTANGNFVYVEMKSGAKGWLPLDAVTTAYNTEALSVMREIETATSPPKTFTIIEDTALLDWPSENTGEMVALLDANDGGTLLSRTSSGRFVYVETDLGAKGWVDADMVQSEYPLDALIARVPAEVEIVVVGTIVPDAGANIREQANLEGEVITALPKGEPVVLLWRTSSNEWLYVSSPDTGDEGWVFAELINTDYDITKLPTPTD